MSYTAPLHRAISALSLLCLVGASACQEDDNVNSGPATGGTGGSAAGGSGGIAGSAGSAGSTGGAAGSTGGAAGSTGGAAGSTGGAAGAASTTASVSGIVTDYTNPVAGVEVCWIADDSIPCVTSDTDGRITLAGLPAYTFGAISFDGEGWVRMLIWSVTAGPGDTQAYTFSVDTDQWLEDFYTDCGETLNPSKGTFVPETRLAGVELSVDPQSGFGPMYFTSAWAPDPNATSTSSAGLALFGNVDVGEIQFTATPTSGPCLVPGLPAGTAATIAIEPDSMSYVMLNCN